MGRVSSLEQIAAAAETADGASAVDEATWRALRHHPERVRSWVEESGFALLVDDEVTLVVSPDARGRGIGHGLLSQVLKEVGEGRLLAWSHGDHPAAAALAAAYGFERVRELWVMRRLTSLELVPLVAPDGVVVRGYANGDAAEVLRVNAAAFAHHPEQGGMDHADLAARMAEVEALAGTTGASDGTASQVAALTAEVEGLRSGLAEAEALSRRVLDGPSAGTA